MRTGENCRERVVLACIYCSMPGGDLWIQQIRVETSHPIFVSNTAVQNRPNISPARGKFSQNLLVTYALSRTICLGQHIMCSCPFAYAAPSLQSVLACRPEVDAAVDPTCCGFFRGIHTGRKTAEHSGKKI